MTRGGGWRAEVEARVGELEDRLAAVCVVPAASEESLGCNPSSEAVTRAAIKARVEDELKRAIAAANEGEREWRRGWPCLRQKGPRFSWWTGTSITKGWEAVHNAELALLRIESPAAVLAAVPRLRTWMQRTMDAGSLREGHERALEKQVEKGEGESPDRTKIRAALADVMTENARRYAAVRTFRNNLILTTVGLAALLVFLGAWHYHHIHFLTLCTKDVNAQTNACLGGTGPARSDVGVVLLMGALGGLLGIALGFAESNEATRYDPKLWLVFLKPVTGAATALVAVLFIQSHLLVEFSAHRKTELLAYAVLFGFSQQLLTGLVDKRAGKLITPS